MEKQRQEEMRAADMSTLKAALDDATSCLVTLEGEVYELQKQIHEKEAALEEQRYGLVGLSMSSPPVCLNNYLLPCAELLSRSWMPAWSTHSGSNSRHLTMRKKRRSRRSGKKPSWHLTPIECETCKVSWYVCMCNMDVTCRARHLRLRKDYVRPMLEPEYSEKQTYDKWFDETQMKPMMDEELHDFVAKATAQLVKLTEAQVNWAMGKRVGSRGKPWKMPEYKVRKLWDCNDKAMTARLMEKLRIFLKVASTHPHAPWIIAFHGMRMTKARQDVARAILMGGYDYAVGWSVCLSLLSGDYLT